MLWVTYAVSNLFCDWWQTFLRAMNYFTEKEIEDLCTSCGLTNYTSKVQQTFIMFSAQKPWNYKFRSNKPRFISILGFVISLWMWYISIVFSFFTQTIPEKWTNSWYKVLCLSFHNVHTKGLMFKPKLELHWCSQISNRRRPAFGMVRANNDCNDFQSMYQTIRCSSKWDSFCEFFAQTWYRWKNVHDSNYSFSGKRICCLGLFIPIINK